MSISPRTVGAIAAVLMLALAPSGARAQITVVDMIPASLSSEVNNDKENFIAVNPNDPRIMTATAFMITPAASPNGPLLVSLDGGNTWSANNIIPSSGGGLVFGDATVHFNFSGSALYASIVRNPSGNLEVLRTTDLTFVTPMTILESRPARFFGDLDQPHIDARTVTGWFDAGVDRLWITTNFAGNAPNSATIDQCLDAAVASPAFTQIKIDAGTPVGRDNYQTRPVSTADGHVYAAFYRLKGGNTADVVVVREDDWGKTTPPFVVLVDTVTTIAGQNVAANTPISDTNASSPTLGNEWWGGDLNINVDPRDSSQVYISYQDSTPTAANTLHLRRSTDFGQNWGPDLLTTVQAKNSAVAINSAGKIAYSYQQLTGVVGSHRWETHLRRSTDGTTWDNLTLSDFPGEGAGAPAGSRIVGDYSKVMAVGKNFYGVFSASNSVTTSSFPQGVTYLRNRNATNLLGTDNVTVITPSIDPFFFRSIEVDPSTDFYVRDWTDNAATRDHGAEPSVRSDFFSTSDVWNERANDPQPFDANDRPQSQDPQPQAMGPNFAFSRVSREAAGSAAAVTLQYLFSDGGVGVNYVSAGAATTLNLAAADTQQTPAAGAGLQWDLPSGTSNHVCLAVEISTATDPVIPPSLLGRAPGWPTTDLNVVNDNNKAQRNLQVFGFAGEAPTAGQFAMNAQIHNAATVTRDVQIGLQVDPDDLARLSTATIQTVGAFNRTTVQAHGIFTLGSMAPGEDRWVELTFTPSYGSPAPSPTLGANGYPSGPGYGSGSHRPRTRPPIPVSLVEIKDGQSINGYALVPTEQQLTDAIRDTLTQTAAVMFRLDTAFGIAGARDQALRALAALHLTAFHRGKARNKVYELYLARNATAIATIASTFVNDITEADPFGLGDAGSKFQAASSSAIKAQPLQLTLMAKLDGAQSMEQKSSGGVIADIPQNVRWQGELFGRLKSRGVPGAADVVEKSATFASRFASRQVGAGDFGDLLASVRGTFDAAAARDSSGRCRRALDGLAGASSPAALQKAHRQFLLALDSTIGRR